MEGESSNKCKKIKKKTRENLLTIQFLIRNQEYIIDFNIIKFLTVSQVLSGIILSFSSYRG